jgi:hypothetical protein
VTSFKNKKLLALVLLSFLVLIIGALFFVMKDSAGAPAGMREVKSYDPNGLCQSAIDPECGNCPNTTIEGKCYVNKGELEQYR